MSLKSNHQWSTCRIHLRLIAVTNYVERCSSKVTASVFCLFDQEMTFDTPTLSLVNSGVIFGGYMQCKPHPPFKKSFLFPHTASILYVQMLIREF